MEERKAVAGITWSVIPGPVQLASRVAAPPFSNIRTSKLCIPARRLGRKTLARVRFACRPSLSRIWTPSSQSAEPSSLVVEKL